MTPSAFIDALSAIHLDAVFKPYSDRCDFWDRADAPRRRRGNLPARAKDYPDRDRLALRFEWFKAAA